MRTTSVALATYSHYGIVVELSTYSFELSSLAAD